MALELEIRKKLGTFHLDVHFKHEEGILGLLGHSGCGKSITLKCVAGIIKPDAGRIVLNGRVLFDSAQKINLKAKERRVGYLFQKYVLFNNMTVEQNVMSGMRLPAVERRAAAYELMERFYLLGQEKKYPRQLSGGQQQRVALARMLASEPELILLDEPFSALDSFLKHQVEQTMMNLFEQFNGDVVYVTHNRDEVNHFCDRVCVLDEGSLVETVAKNDLFRKPTRLSSAKLSGCKNFSRIRAQDDACGVLWAEDWQSELCVARPVQARHDYIGVRSHHVRPSATEGFNCVRIRPFRVIDQLFDLTVLAWPVAADGRVLCDDPLRMDLAYELWEPFKGMEELWAFIPPAAIMLLES